MAYKNGETLSNLHSTYRIRENTLYNWVEHFERDELQGLVDSKTWKQYSKELKEIAVRGYLSEECSQNEIIRKYGNSCRSVLQRWIKMYNDHRESVNTGRGKSSSMTKGRKTTWKERIEIVQDGLESGKDYEKTAEIHQVSYQQVYQ